jgi:hypothetical protein
LFFCDSLEMERRRSSADHVVRMQKVDCDVKHA